jgi:hypothetical protein
MLAWRACCAWCFGFGAGTGLTFFGVLVLVKRACAEDGQERERERTSRIFSGRDYMRQRPPSGGTKKAIKPKAAFYDVYALLRQKEPRAGFALLRTSPGQQSREVSAVFWQVGGTAGNGTRTVAHAAAGPPSPDGALSTFCIFALALAMSAPAAPLLFCLGARRRLSSHSMQPTSSALHKNTPHEASIALDSDIYHPAGPFISS